MPRPDNAALEKAYADAASAPVHKPEDGPRKAMAIALVSIAYSLRDIVSKMPQS